MSANTTIEWATKSWNPVRGCSRVSPGCDHCYAMGQAHRFAGPGKPYDGLTKIRKGKVDWSGVARFIPTALDEPLRWKQPERVFVNSMSDLFHHSITFEQIDRIFGVMWACLYVGRGEHTVDGHTFLVLTKRPERMAEYFSEDRCERWSYAAVHAGGGENPDALFDQTFFHKGPHPRIHLGVSCENQATADERIPLLLRCPASVHWVSAEPLLGPLDLSPWLSTVREFEDATARALGEISHDERDSAIARMKRDRLGAPADAKLRWVVPGGESGPGARPLDLVWMRELVRSCQDTRTALFCKQFGRLVVDSDRKAGSFVQHDRRSIAAANALGRSDNPPNLVVLANRKGSDLGKVPGDWPRQLPSTDSPMGA